MAVPSLRQVATRKRGEGAALASDCRPVIASQLPKSHISTEGHAAMTTPPPVEKGPGALPCLVSVGLLVLKNSVDLGPVPGDEYVAILPRGLSAAL
jgi:hypothetical protein